jgi:hypothetical protein
MVEQIDDRRTRHVQPGTKIIPDRPASHACAYSRNLPVDTQGLLLCAIIHAADIQDRDGGVMLMSA